jgi:ATP adenylyltransferase
MMTFEELKRYLTSEMKMSHIYQPILIRGLLENGGTANIKQIATYFSLDKNRSLHYQKIIKVYPLNVLSKNGIIKYEEDLIKLLIDNITQEQKAELEKICEQRLR